MFNEWTFEPDPAGRTLSSAENVGTMSAIFGPGGSGFLETDGAGELLCTYDAVTNGIWSDGAILNAGLASETSGVRYVRYDFEYQLDSTNNNSGTVLALSFNDGSSNVAGLVFSYDLTGTMVPPAGTELIPFSEELYNPITLDASGHMSAIAKVDMDQQTMAVWYDLSGANQFNEDIPATNNVAITLNSFSDLQFRATGDFRPAGSTDHVNIDNIRTADTWGEIAAEIRDFSTGPAVALVSVTLTNDAGTAGTNIGDTNIVSVVIQNMNAPATNVMSTFTPPSGAEAYFTITSNNYGVVLAYPQSTTNTFTVIANPGTPSGTYNFNVDVTADGGFYTNSTFALTVGSLFSYKSNTVAEVSGGFLPGKYEPGELIDVTIFGVNDGANDLTNVVNSLSGNQGYFTISNLSSVVYSFMPVGAETSTVYRIAISAAATNGTYEFSVTNQAGSRVWVDSFALDVYSQSVPSVSPGSLSITTAAGQTAQGAVVVSNGGNKELIFTITNNASWSSVLTVDTSASPSSKLIGTTPIPLNDPNSYMDGASDGESDTIDIGFTFPFYGTNYTKLYIDSNGAIILSSSNRVSNTNVADPGTGDLPRGTRPLIAPFRHKQLVVADASPVRYIRTAPDRLALIYSNVTLNVLTVGTNLQFQVELFADGQIKFSYFNINGSQLNEVAIGVQGDADHFTNFDFIPDSGKALQINRNQDQWVSYSPAGGSILPFSSKEITFTADGTSQSAGTSNNFTAIFNWEDGGASNMDVYASVLTAAPILVAPASVFFSGNAGDVASTTMVLSNSGTAELNFTITDTNTASAAYQGAVSVSTNWTDISTNTSLNMLDPHENPYINATNEGFSALQPIGFAFPFYGGVYTQFSAGVNGGISLGTTNRISAGNNFGSLREDVPQQFIAPYWGNLFLDTNASIRFHSTTNELVVTWRNMEQQGIIPGIDLTFQAVLYASGHIEFRYQQINGFSWQFTKGGLRSSSSAWVKWTSGLLVLPSDEIVTTNEYGYLKTNVVNTISNRMVSITSSNYPVITYTPSQGTIPVGGAATVTLQGNAAGLTPGSPFNSITNTADLYITYEVTNNVVSATFVATNSVENTMISPLGSPLDEDGDGLTYDEELIAGTDPLDSSSVLVIKTDAGRDLSWDAAPERTYTILYTLDLKDDFQPLEGAAGLTTNRFIDAAHSGVPVIYYKVTID